MKALFITGIVLVSVIIVYGEAHGEGAAAGKSIRLSP